MEQRYELICICNLLLENMLLIFPPNDKTLSHLLHTVNRAQNRTLNKASTKLKIVLSVFAVLLLLETCFPIPLHQLINASQLR